MEICALWDCSACQARDIHLKSDFRTKNVWLWLFAQWHWAKKSCASMDAWTHGERRPCSMLRPQNRTRSVQCPPQFKLKPISIINNSINAEVSTSWVLPSQSSESRVPSSKSKWRLHGMLKKAPAATRAPRYENILAKPFKFWAKVSKNKNVKGSEVWLSEWNFQSRYSYSMEIYLSYKPGFW